MLEVFLLRSWKSRKPFVSRIKMVKTNVITIVTHAKPYLQDFESTPADDLHHKITAKAAQGDSSDLDYTAKVTWNFRSEIDEIRCFASFGYRIIFRFHEVAEKSKSNSKSKYMRQPDLQLIVLDSNNFEPIQHIDVDQAVFDSLMDHLADLNRLLAAFPSCAKMEFEMKLNQVTVSVDDKEILSVPRYGICKVTDESHFRLLTKTVGYYCAGLKEYSNGILPSLVFVELVNEFLYYCQEIFSSSYPSLIPLQAQLAKELADLLRKYEKFILQNGILLGESNPSSRDGSLDRIKEELEDLNAFSSSPFTQPFCFNLEKYKMMTACLSVLSKSGAIDRDLGLLQSDSALVVWSCLDEVVQYVLPHFGIESGQKASRPSLITRIDKQPMFNPLLVQGVPTGVSTKLTTLFRQLTNSQDEPSFIVWKSQYAIARGISSGHNIIVDLPSLSNSSANTTMDSGGYSKALKPLPGHQDTDQETASNYNAARGGLFGQAFAAPSLFGGSSMFQSSLFAAPAIGPSLFAPSTQTGGLFSTASELRNNPRPKPKTKLVAMIQNTWGITLLYRNPKSHGHNLTICCLKNVPNILKMDWQQLCLWSREEHGSQDPDLDLDLWWSHSRRYLVAHNIEAETGKVSLVGFEFTNRGVRTAELLLNGLGDEQPQTELQNIYCSWICKYNKMFSILCDFDNRHLSVYCLIRGRFSRISTTHIDWKISGIQQSREPLFCRLNVPGTDVSQIIIRASAKTDQAIYNQFFRLVPILQT